MHTRVICVIRKKYITNVFGKGGPRFAGTAVPVRLSRGLGRLFFMDQPFEAFEHNVYNLMQKQLEETFSAPDVTDVGNDGLEGRAYRKSVFSSYLRENREVLACSGIFALCALHLFIRVILYGVGLAKIDTAYTTGSLISCVAAALIPLLNWVYSTKLKVFSFHQRKLMLLRFCLATFAVMVACFIYHHVGNVLIPLIVALFKPTISRSVAMVKMLCRVLMFLVSVVPGIMIYATINRYTKDEILQTKIINFDISMMLDFRDKDSKEFSYDMRIVKDLSSGKQFTIKEKDRFLHALDDGVTGAGKTSSTFTPALEEDFEQRLHNLEHQKMGVEKLLAQGRVRMKEPMLDVNFDIDNFEALDKKAEKELYRLKYKSPLAGIIAMAPNEMFSDEIYALARANGMPVHRVDPLLSPEGRLKEGFVGLNPIYIKPGLSEVQYLIEVNQRATLFADVMQAVYDKSGQSNPYFAGLNQNITTSVTALILLCAPYMPEKFADQGRVPVATDVQDVLNDFSKAKEYNKVFKKYYAKPGTHRNESPDFGKLQYIYDVVNGRLLGADSSQLFDQCQGLRNIINQLLGNPMICNILCSQNTIDLDRVLAKGEIVLVNYALNLGSDGVTFGLFFLLSLIQAAYRRPAPESERLPCFIYIDELPQLLHPKLEACFALFRQYRMAMFVAIQSLSQLDKSRSTAFLKQVLLGNCAHHFVFGRAGVEDMEIYAALAGTRLSAVLTESRNETSLLASNPTVSYQHRVTNQRVNNIEGSDIHDRKFQECTVITVNSGTPVAAFAAMVFFLPRWKRESRRRYEVDWRRYYTAYDRLDGAVPDTDRPAADGEDLYGDAAAGAYMDADILPRRTLSVDVMEGDLYDMPQEPSQAANQASDAAEVIVMASPAETGAFRLSAGHKTTCPVEEEPGEQGTVADVLSSKEDAPDTGFETTAAAPPEDPSLTPRMFQGSVHARDEFYDGSDHVADLTVSDEACQDSPETPPEAAWVQEEELFSEDGRINREQLPSEREEYVRDQKAVAPESLEQAVTDKPTAPPLANLRDEDHGGTSGAADDSESVTGDTLQHERQTRVLDKKESVRLADNSEDGQGQDLPDATVADARGKVSGNQEGGRPRKNKKKKSPGGNGHTGDGNLKTESYDEKELAKQLDDITDLFNGFL